MSKSALTSALTKVPFARSVMAKSVSLASAGLVAMPVVSVDAATGSSVIEEVIVTSSRREQSVQDIPINITAVSDTMIKELRLDGIAEIARYVPA